LFKRLVVTVSLFALVAGIISPATASAATSNDGKKWSRAELKIDGKKYYLSAPSVIWNGKQFVTIGGVIIIKNLQK
jgi:hypothetical protein